MFNNEEEVNRESAALVPVAAFTHALPTVTSEQQNHRDAQAEMFARYQAASEAGIISRLITFTKRHGTLNGEKIKWHVERDSLVLDVDYLKTGALEVRRNGQVVLDDKSGRKLIFKPGAQGAWLLALEAEHEDLERDAVVDALLAARQAENEAEARRNEFP